ncbi:hypothetical protein K435DRAFT_762055 [Dendrothele bispora CBS 962.96]|uniref:Sm domain-containing protein n=1 Tax=Dendrothele bispora (strain CBS 962.96) TaxID=1314807 RepID=A0A4S8LGR8_DENBC|nr:hypothetical protein K435DRAFT_762055 [Dendrothele bispora CBS 962.96]
MSNSLGPIDTLKSLLRTTLRITVTDGRIFLGAFVGTDKPMNILLMETEEFRLGPGENPNGRYVGQVMIPWKMITKIEAQDEVLETRDQLGKDMRAGYIM